MVKGRVGHTILNFFILMNSITVESNYRLEIVDQKCSSLEISQADLKDTGSYKCIANNDFGNAAVTFIVNINGESFCRGTQRSLGCF